MRLAQRRTVGPLALLILVVCAGLCSAGVFAARPHAKVVHASLAPAASTEELGLDLLHALPPGNLVVSPDSVATALAMAGTGARGRTQEQIAKVLHLGEAPLTSLGVLQSHLGREAGVAGEGHANAPTFDTASGLFVQSGFPLQPEFIEGLGKRFGAAPEALDFAADPTASVKVINSWTSEHTQGVIRRLFSKLPAETRLVLASAVYLKAQWRHKFERSATDHAPFYGSAGRVPAEFMRQTEDLNYATGPGYREVELPYRASDLSMLVVLPTEGGITALERRIGETGLSGLARALRHQPVELSLPRFHLKTETALVKTLSALGMPDAFGEAADFSGITAAERLRIGAVEHVADIRVDEEGTEAAATGIVGFTGEFFGESQKIFNANHPFLFFVRDVKTGAVLFAGRLTNPATATAE